MLNNILVVCVGNICRSPMAEAIFKHCLRNHRINLSVSSAGISALIDNPADPLVQEILLEQGIDCSEHIARQLTSNMLIESDLVLVMEHWQRKKIMSDLPIVHGKVHLLGKWGHFEIPDPYKRPKEIFKHTYHLIQHGIEQWLNQLNNL